jgi:hypothetical protein
MIFVAIVTASLFAGCSMEQQSTGSSAYTDGHNYGNSYWPQAKDNGLSYAQECSALSGNAPSGDDLDQWEAGCIAAGKADVSDGNS